MKYENAESDANMEYLEIKAPAPDLSLETIKFLEKLCKGDSTRVGFDEFDMQQFYAKIT